MIEQGVLRLYDVLFQQSMLAVIVIVCFVILFGLIACSLMSIYNTEFVTLKKAAVYTSICAFSAVFIVVIVFTLFAVF